MSEALFLAVGLLAGYLVTFRETSRLQVALAVETVRVATLFRMLGAKTAPAEFFAATAPEPDASESWVWDDTGLVGYPESHLPGP